MKLVPQCGEGEAVKLTPGLALAAATGGTEANGVVTVVGVGEPVAEDPFNGSLFGSGFAVALGAGLVFGCKAVAGLIGAVVVLPCFPALPVFVCAEINDTATAHAARIPNNFV